MKERLGSIDLTEVLAKFPCAPEAMDLAATCESPSALIQQLQANDMSVDAVRGLARCMPKEKAVQWAAESARMAAEKTGGSPEEATALTAVEAWCKDPSPITRAAAADAAGNLSPDSPAYWAANAAGFSEKIDAPEALLRQVGADDLTAHFSASSVLLSAAKLSPVNVPEIPPADIIPVTDKAMAQTISWPEAPPSPELTPAQQAQAGPDLAPFIEKGIKIAQSVPGWW